MNKIIISSCILGVLVVLSPIHAAQPEKKQTEQETIPVAAETQQNPPDASAPSYRHWLFMVTGGFGMNFQQVT